jgi:hypothetical protein
LAAVLADGTRRIRILDGVSGWMDEFILIVFAPRTSAVDFKKTIPLIYLNASSKAAMMKPWWFHHVAAAQVV